MLKKNAVFVILSILSFLSSSLKAQENNPSYSHYATFKPESKESLYLRIENLNFAKNNEYTGKFAKGATFFGYILSPKLVYYPTSNLRFEAGVRLQKYSGLSGFTNNTPVFSIHYQANEKWAFILGSLNQDDNHHLHEALFEPERYFTDKGENGIQILLNSKRIKSDIWINWEQFIFKNDPFQEKFTFGISANFRLNNLDSDYALSIPIQSLYTHRGGEIDASDDNKQTISTNLIGLSLKKKINGSRLKSWEIEALSFSFEDQSADAEFGYKKGDAMHLRFGISTKHSNLKIGYWQGNKFNSLKGSALFQSMSSFDKTHIRKERSLITAKYRIQKTITKGILIGGQYNLYLDMNSAGDLSHATSVFIRLNGDFFLKKLKWN